MLWARVADTQDNPMHDLADIARLEEGHCALTLREIGRETIDIGGGVACRDVPGTWVNRAEGLGLSGPVSAEEIARLTAWYDQAGIEAQAKVCPYVDESLLPHMAAAGFIVKRFEQLLYRELRLDELIEPPQSLPPEYELRTVDPSDHARARELAELVYRGFAAPGAALSEPHIALSMKCIQRHRAVTIAAYRNGVCVGGGGMESLGAIAGLYGVVVDPSHRRRGIQQALIAARLNAAINRGISIATIGSSPGHDTERNVLRFGFRVAYTKSVMMRPRREA
jgi:GNAT superfamily N-acetyltransferase